MLSIIYFAISVLGASALWVVWDQGIKKLVLDQFREKLFEVRFELFSMAANQEIEFDNEAYRSVETLICGLQRFAHRLTFMTYIFSNIAQDNAKRSKDYVDFHQHLQLKVNRTTPENQVKLQKILRELNHAVSLYTALSSVLFMMTIPIAYLLHNLNLLKNFTKSKVANVLESEAYRAEDRSSHMVRAGAV